MTELVEARGIKSASYRGLKLCVLVEHHHESWELMFSALQGEWSGVSWKPLTLGILVESGKNYYTEDWPVHWKLLCWQARLACDAALFQERGRGAFCSPHFEPLYKLSVECGVSVVYVRYMLDTNSLCRATTSLGVGSGGALRGSKAGESLIWS